MFGCPVNAYEKDPVTGIVRHLDDQCIGCQYCVLTCPYAAPRYHAGKGIVRKCDICSDRLEGGEAPACVQSCPTSAIRIRVVSIREVVEASEANVFLPGAPEPEWTLPTTSYKSARPFPRNLLPADFYRASPQHGHFALVFMLVLTQLSVGAFVTSWRQPSATAIESSIQASMLHAAAAMLFGFLGMGAAIFHLGRPLYAFRALLGLRTSWLSREILAFNLFAGAGVLCAACRFLASGRSGAAAAWADAFHVLAVAAGVAGVWCSALIYAVTGRELWKLPATLFRFFGTTMLLGAAATLAAGALSAQLFPHSLESFAPAVRAGAIWLIAISAVKLAYELSVLGHLRSRRMTAMKRSAMLLTGDLYGVLVRRVCLGAIGGLLLPTLLLWNPNATASTSPLFSMIVCTLILLCLSAGELMERYLFFTAVAAPKMPGGILR